MIKKIPLLIFFFLAPFAYAQEANKNIPNQVATPILATTPAATTPSLTEPLPDDVINLYSKDDPSAFYPKKPTPSRFFATELSMPDQFVTSNNLAKKVGSFYRAFGEIIFLQGKVTDSFGVPIEGAIIEIWQTNAAGKYHSLLEPNSEYIDKHLNMSGRTITDNLGNYHFISIMPGASTGRAPHINANIYHTKFGKLETEIYFEDHPFNKTDYQYLAYDDEERTALTSTVKHSDIYDTKSIKICTFNVILKGIHQYKKF
jgi:protocatechuate 3,4-dioxygenase beta subunit